MLRQPVQHRIFYSLLWITSSGSGLIYAMTKNIIIQIYWAYICYHFDIRLENWFAIIILRDNNKFWSGNYCYRPMLQRSKPLTRMLFSKAKIKIDFNKDYYSILGIDSRSNAKTIRLSYLKMVKEHHPDAQPTQSNL